MADGIGCTCYAYSENECACEADWTPQEIYDLRAQLAECHKAALLEAAAIVRASSSREHADLVLCAMAEGK